MQCIVLPLRQHIDGLAPPCESRADSCRSDRGSRSDSVQGNRKADCQPGVACKAAGAWLPGGGNTDSIVPGKARARSEASPCAWSEQPRQLYGCIRWQTRQLAGQLLGPSHGTMSSGNMRLHQPCCMVGKPASPATMTGLTSTRGCRLRLSILCSTRSPQGCKKAHSMPWIQTDLSRDDLKYHYAKQAGTSCIR